MRVITGKSLWLCLMLVALPALADEQKQLAIWPIDIFSYGMGMADEESQMLSTLVPDFIAASLSNSAYRLVERERLLNVLTELNLSSSELADEETRLRLGRLLGAGYMLFGHYTKLGDSWRLDLRVVNTETSQVVASTTATEEQGDLLAVAQRIGLSLLPDGAAALDE